MRNFLAMPGFLRLLTLLGVIGMLLMLLAAATMGVEVQGQVIDARSWRSSGGAWVALIPFVFTAWSSILMLVRRAYGRWIYLVAMSLSNVVIPLAIGMAGVVVPEATMRLAMGASAVMAVVLGFSLQAYGPISAMRLLTRRKARWVTGGASHVLLVRRS